LLSWLKQFGAEETRDAASMSYFNLGKSEVDVSGRLELLG